jgi:pimeloyl-ACP methyl ester carboxylesterase
VTSPPLLVLHEVGDPEGGAPWRSALTDAGWEGPVLAPDLPGHAGEPPPVDGNYELLDGAWLALKVLGGLDDGPKPVIVAVGTNGWAAQMLALGGRAAGVVLVDGLGGPWRSPAEWTADQRDWMRAVADDPAALAASPPGAPLDPRLRHGVVAMTSRSLAEEAAAAMPVPVLVIETPQSTADGALLGHFPASTVVEHVVDRRPADVAPAVVRWTQTLDAAT